MTDPVADPTISITRGALREAVRQQWYPRVPLEDEVGQNRVGRATAHLLEKLNVDDAPDQWSDELPPGGAVCGGCGQPVESEPCRDDQPRAFFAETAYRAPVAYEDEIVEASL